MPRLIAACCGAMALAMLLAAAAPGAEANDPVRVSIGVLNDQSGIGAALAGPGSVIAARLAIQDFQAAHSGSEIRLLSADHNNKPDLGSSIARRWFDEENVTAIFDVPSSGVALAVAGVATTANKVFVASGAGTADLTGPACGPTIVQWTYDTWALANSTAAALTQEGGRDWFFITSDYAFGLALERDARDAIARNGGTVIGNVRHPLGATDYSAFLLQAQASHAKVIGLATSAGDLVNLLKQSNEFGVRQGGQQLASLLLFISDVHAIGLETAAGLVLTSPFYWDRDDGTRTWSRRFAAANKDQMPTMVQAGVYASVMHYLKALDALAPADRIDGTKAVNEMKALPTDDLLFGKGSVRQDGRVLHDMYLYRVKAPKDSRYPWDYYQLLATIPAKKAFRPMAEGGCRFVK